MSIIKIFKIDLSYCFIFITIVTASFVGNIAVAQQAKKSRDFLMNALQATSWKLDSEAISKWRAEQKQDILKRIAALPDSVKKSFENKANQALMYSWQVLPASSFLEFKKNGNRIGFEKKQLERREHLYNLVIAFLLTNETKYLTPLVNGLWATLEESTWEIPAILELQKIGADLPDPSEQIIGLVNAETSVNIAMMQWLLKDQLDDISPVINRRVSSELKKRFFDPYLYRNDFWWMGFRGHNVNNWNAWINTNVLHAALLVESNMDTLQQLIAKSFRSADYFINQYPEDGGCDEGTSYWNEAGGKLIRMLTLAKSASNGVLKWDDKNVLLNMGTYIYKMHIDGSFFVNFADAVPVFIPDPESVYLYGQMFQNRILKEFAAYLFDLKGRRPESKTLVNFIQSTLLFESLTATNPLATKPKSVFLPDLQIAIARTEDDSNKELFLAVQGGNNAESHNHNDVGNFILYGNGKPLIIDAGVGTYNAQTFSNKRYELWNMQSQWHNCPTINGVMQQEGNSYKAAGFTMKDLKKGSKIDLDIAKAYPENAGVRFWKRSFSVIKNKILLRESYQLEKYQDTTKSHFLTVCKPHIEKPGLIVFHNKTGIRVLQLKYDPSGISIRIDYKNMEDPKMVSSWGEGLYRVSFLIRDKPLNKVIDYEFSVP